MQSAHWLQELLQPLACPQTNCGKHLMSWGGWGSSCVYMLLCHTRAKHIGTCAAAASSDTVRQQSPYGKPAPAADNLADCQSSCKVAMRTHAARSLLCVGISCFRSMRTPLHCAALGCMSCGFVGWLSMQRSGLWSALSGLHHMAALCGLRFLAHDSAGWWLCLMARRSLAMLLLLATVTECSWFQGGGGVSE